jgi:PBSX family phage terminase large subunit
LRRLNPKQDEFIFCEDQSVCIKGTWGCGKSLAGLIAACKECEEIADNLYLIIRKEWVDLRDSTIKDWIAEFGDRYPVVGNEVRFPNGSLIMFRHGDDLNSLKNANLGGALMVQAEEMTEDDYWFLKGRLRRKEGTRRLRIECNYDGHNWIYRLFNEQGVGTLITTNTFDNEENLPPDYIPNLKKLPKRIQDRHLYGTDDDAEGLVWDEFNYGRHVVEPYPIHSDWRDGFVLDHGFRNPTAVLWYAIDFDGNIIIYDEHFQKEKPVSHHAREIKKRGITSGICDPSVFNKTQSKGDVIYSIADEYKDEGIKLSPAYRSSEEATLNRVNEFFKAGRIQIFKSCPNLIKEIQNWKWECLKPGANRNDPERPEDKDNHGADCLKYLVATRFKPSTEPGEELNPNSAYGRLMARRKNTNQEVYH